MQYTVNEELKTIILDKEQSFILSEFIISLQKIEKIFPDYKIELSFINKSEFKNDPNFWEPVNNNPYTVTCSDGIELITG